MKVTLDEAKLELVDEYERTGNVHVGRWLVRLPEDAQALLDFSFALLNSPRDETPLGEWLDEGGIARQAIANALSVFRMEAELGEQMSRVRASDLPQPTGKARPPFRRAAVNAWVVDQLRGDHRGVSRLAAQKTTYLLERALSLGLFTEHQRMTFGPYDPTSRYKDAEPIGKSQQWIESEGYDLVIGPKIETVHRFALNYLGAPDLAKRFVRLLSNLSRWELETWATVEAVSTELIASSRPVNVESIRSLLASSEVWAGKLRRSNFSEDAILDALGHLRRLRLILG